MNKHEAIKKVEQMGEYERFVNESIPKLSVLNILNQLYEPQKPVVPQFVADWYEERKNNIDFEIWHYLHTFSSQKEDEFKKWMNKLGLKQIQTLVNMHQFGYEVEKEKRYFVKVKGMKCVNGCLAINKKLAIWFFGTSGNSNNYRTHHTRKELEQAGFGWVFDCEGIEIEEVTE